MLRLISFAAVFALALVWAASPAAACPFCTAQSQTFSEEMTSMDVALIAELVEAAPAPNFDDTAGFAEKAKPSKFKAIHILKGESLVKEQGVIETPFFGEGKKGDRFLLMGVNPPALMWSSPLRLSEAAVAYLKTLPTLPKEGPDRLAFFQDYLEHSDEMLTADAYDEFAKTPYAIVKALKPRMKRDELVEWIKDPDTPASRRRLYFTMLGVCGTEADLPMLEELLKADDRKAKAGLDAMVACYLTLKGADGLPLIEDLYLKNDKAEYADTYAAIMAIRFHGSDGGVIPQKPLVLSLRHMLERPQLADLVIPDLARWEDWESMDRLVRLFKESDDKTSWVRVPVINFLRACPLPEAKEHIAELEKIDPAAVKRASTFFPVPAATSGGTQTTPPAKQSSSASDVMPPLIEPIKSAATPASPQSEPAPKGVEVATRRFSLMGIGGPVLAAATFVALMALTRRTMR